MLPLDRDRVRLQMMSLAQDGAAHIRDILVSLLYSGRKWRRVVHLYIQSMGLAQMTNLCAKDNSPDTTSVIKRKKTKESRPAV